MCKGLLLIKPGERGEREWVAYVMDRHDTARVSERFLGASPRLAIDAALLSTAPQSTQNPEE